jgi:uncharacterized tannase-like protein DUF6351
MRNASGRMIALFVTATLATLLACAGAAAYSGRAAATIPASHLVRILVLSDRADLISGGDALVEIVLPARTSPSSVKVSVGRRAVTSEFALRPNGDFEGLVTGLMVGRNVLTARLPDGYGARIRITNHPIGGPVFSGPQVEPWVCQPGALDKQCDEPPKYSYLYESTDPSKSGLQPYNPADPPSDVAMTTTDAGVTVPFIVREETGFEDRDEYRIEVLYQPGKSWAPWAPQAQWNHKVLIMHGGSCSTDFQPTSPPFTDYSGTLPASGVPAVEDSSQVGLGLGFAVMSTALDNSGVDCNPALQAESLVMAKEHLIDEYGPIEYTIGTGCSGGSLAEQWIANAYPGVYQGLIAQCSFPDAGSTGQQIVDYEALGNYFTNASGWTPAQEAEVEGTGVENLPVPVDSTFSAYEYFPLITPTGECYDNGLTASEYYNPQTDPGGVRCGILDWDIDLLGPQPKSAWDQQEKEVGRGFAGNPIDNVGVQYGLAALNAGQITPAQFLDVNAKIGGFNTDWEPTPQRLTADEPALANAYRTGIINEANNLNQVPIIDLRGPNDPGLAHDSYRSFAMRGRLERDFGTYANQVIWEGPTPIIGDVQYTAQALRAMDRWLEAVQQDRSSKSLPQKVIADKPSDITDQCSNGDGVKISSILCPSSVVPVYGTPRTVAGEPITTDQNKCQLVPLERSSYKVTFTDAQWAQLKAIFPTGVCDYSKLGVSQQPTIPWLTYLNAQGKVIYGGRPLGPAPVSIPFAGCASPSGRLAGYSLGPVTLGMTRARARALVPYFSTRGRRSMDFFCLAGGPGIRVAYPSPKLLVTLSQADRQLIRGRVVMALTASHYYSLRGVRPGARLSAVARRLQVGKGLHIGRNWWYLAPNGPSTGVLKVRRGIIDEVGIADKQLTNTPSADWRFLNSFGSPS